MSCGYVRLAYLGCATSFLAIVVIFFGVDLNGRLFGMETDVTVLAGVASATFGLWSNIILFRHRPKERFVVSLLGLMCIYCLVEMCRLWVLNK
jgi:hypothetical protein